MSDLTKIVEEYPIFMTAKELIEMFAKMRRMQSRGDPPKPKGGRWSNAPTTSTLNRNSEKQKKI